MINYKKRDGLADHPLLLWVSARLLRDDASHLENLVGVTPLVVVPSANLYECAIELDTCLLIEDGGVSVVAEVCGNDSLVGVTENTVELALRSLFHCSANLLVCASVLELYSEVNERHVRSRNAE